MDNWIIVISTAISAIAALIIAAYTWRLYKLSDEIQYRQKEQDERFSDLFEGLIIATLLSGPSSVGSFDLARRSFLEKYKGKSKIFNK